MLFNYIRFFICVCLFSITQYCGCQFINFRNYDTPTSTPLPFPACRADNIDCLRRGLRTFFFLMDSEYLGMKPVDPIVLNSLTVALPEEQLSILMRRVNVTGARWTKLVERKFNLPGGKNGVRFLSDLHVTGEITMSSTARLDPFVALITMDIQGDGVGSTTGSPKFAPMPPMSDTIGTPPQVPMMYCPGMVSPQPSFCNVSDISAAASEGVESNVTYTWAGQRGLDNDDYIIIGPERIAVRNSRTPTYFLQTEDGEDTSVIDQVFQVKTSVLDHLANEITISLMHSIVDNFRLFANKVPAKHYYTYANVEDN